MASMSPCLRGLRLRLRQSRGSLHGVRHHFRGQLPLGNAPLASGFEGGADEGFEMATHQGFGQIFRDENNLGAAIRPRPVGQGIGGIEDVLDAMHDERLGLTFDVENTLQAQQFFTIQLGQQLERIRDFASVQRLGKRQAKRCDAMQMADVLGMRARRISAIVRVTVVMSVRGMVVAIGTAFGLVIVANGV